MGLIQKGVDSTFRALQISCLAYGLILTFNHIPFGLPIAIIGAAVFLSGKRPKWWVLMLFLIVEIIIVYLLHIYFLKDYAHNGIPMEELHKIFNKES